MIILETITNFCVSSGRERVGGWGIRGGRKKIIEICLREGGRGVWLSDNERSWRRHSGWEMNNVDERFNPFRSAGFSFHRARGLRRRKSMGPH